MNAGAKGIAWRVADRSERREHVRPKGTAGARWSRKERREHLGVGRNGGAKPRRSKPRRSGPRRSKTPRRGNEERLRRSRVHPFRRSYVSRVHTFIAIMPTTPGLDHPDRHSRVARGLGRVHGPEPPREPRAMLSWVLPDFHSRAACSCFVLIGEPRLQRTRRRRPQRRVRLLKSIAAEPRRGGPAARPATARTPPSPP